MERVLHCNVCFQTFNDNQNRPDGVSEQEDHNVNLICKACRIKLSFNEIFGKTENDALKEEDRHRKASSGLTTVRSSKTIKSLENNRLNMKTKAARPRPQTSMLD